MDIDIRPEVNILSVLRHLNYKPWFALAEFVDNALGSYLGSRKLVLRGKLHVDIEVITDGAGRIVVTDDAAGIALADFPRAFRAAQVPPDKTGLSEFGMGMKSAASWFAKRWTVRTSVIGEEIERSVTFDLDQITENKIGTLAVTESWAPADSHFTVIELVGLNHVPQTQSIAKIRSHLGSIYRAFLRDGSMVLKFRGENLAYQEVDVLVAPSASDPDGISQRWYKPIAFELPGGKSVSGFAAIRAIGSTSQAGFALLRRGRLILGSYDEPYRPVEIFGRSNTYTYQRLFGELTLDGFEVSHTKDGFRWEEQEEQFLENLEAQIRSEPVNLFAQASGYRAKSAIDLIAPIEQAASNVAEAVEHHFDTVLESAVVAPSSEVFLPDEVEVVAVKRAIRRTINVEADGAAWEIEIEATLDGVATEWLKVGAVVDESSPTLGRRYRVGVVVSLAHPFSRKFLGPSNENSELIISFASAFGLALALGKSHGAKSFSILHHLNELVRDTFASSSISEEIRG